MRVTRLLNFPDQAVYVFTYVHDDYYMDMINRIYIHPGQPHTSGGKQSKNKSIKTKRKQNFISYSCFKVKPSLFLFVFERFWFKLRL